MTLTEASAKRIADRVSVLCSAKSSNAHEYDLCVRAVKAALADPILRGEIENAAYERAISTIEKTTVKRSYETVNIDDDDMVFYEIQDAFISAIRALKS